MRRHAAAFIACLAVVAGPAASDPPQPVKEPAISVTRAVAITPRPPLRPEGASVRPERGAAPGFARWLEEFRPRARRAGIPAGVIDAAFAGIRYDPAIIARDRNQAEFSRTLWAYLDSAVSAERIRTGRAMLARHDALLRRIEDRYGVDRHVGICGQAPSDHPDFAGFLVEVGIDSISVIPDSVADVIQHVAEAEQRA